MRVTVNGQFYEVPDGLSVKELLDHLKMKANRVAIERNLEILPRDAWISTPVQPGDSFEIVQFVGGGSRQGVSLGDLPQHCCRS